MAFPGALLGLPRPSPANRIVVQNVGDADALILAETDIIRITQDLTAIRTYTLPFAATAKPSIRFEDYNNHTAFFTANIAGAPGNFAGGVNGFPSSWALHGTGVITFYNDRLNSWISGSSIIPSAVGNSPPYFVAGLNVAIFKPSGEVFTHTANANSSGTTETTLYTDTFPAGFFATMGSAVQFTYGGVLVNSVSTKQLRLYFSTAGTTLIFDTGVLAISATSTFSLRGTIMATGTTAVKCVVEFLSTGTSLASSCNYIIVSMSNLNTNASILKLTGTAGAGGANNDVSARIGQILYNPF